MGIRCRHYSIVTYTQGASSAGEALYRLLLCKSMNGKIKDPPDTPTNSGGTTRLSNVYGGPLTLGHAEFTPEETNCHQGLGLLCPLTAHARSAHGVE